MSITRATRAKHAAHPSLFDYPSLSGYLSKFELSAPAGAAPKHAAPRGGLRAGTSASELNLSIFARPVSKPATAVAGFGVLASVLLSGGAAHAASAEDFQRLRQCESGGNYAINTGNGYYGAYQFDRRTWQGLGYSGTANQHSAATQDEAARRLQAARGWQPWPGCARKLGLGDDRASRSRTSAPAPKAKAKAPQAAPKARKSAVTAKAPAFPGRDLSTAMVAQKREDVRIWQRQMQRRGWKISVDGHFGPQSARIAAKFAAEKRVPTTPGKVNAGVWSAAWTAPVS